LHRKTLLYLVSAALTATVTMGFAASIAAASTTLNGDGSTLINPLMAEWRFAYNAKTTGAVTVNYNAVGSGQGIKDITNRLVDFGASDAPLTPSQATACNGCDQIPWALTAVAIGYNLPIRGLHLSGPVLAKMYLGQITKWNDPRIKALNKGKHMPNLGITVVSRHDGSGDSYAFTDYLSRVSGTWASQIGTSTLPAFPVGVQGTGNSGVTALIASTTGAVGYVSAAYLIQNGLKAAAVENAWGNFEFPNFNQIEAAALLVKHVPANNEMHIVDPGKSKKPICNLSGSPREACSKLAYPISTFSYAIVPTNAAQLGALKAFVAFALSSQAQAFGPALDFAPLPGVVVRAARRTLNSL
jgi:phosphate transport system substrate-binding protein